MYFTLKRNESIRFSYPLTPICLPDVYEDVDLQILAFELKGKNL